MNEKEKTAKSAQNVVFEDWIKSESLAWEEALKRTAKTWQVPLGAIPGGVVEEGMQTSSDDIGKGLFEFFQSLASMAGMPKPEDIESAKSFPDIMLKAILPAWGNYTKLQKQWAEMMGPTATDKSEKMAEFLKQMMENFFESQTDDFRKLINIPQLGINRYYQERFNKAIEKASDFQSAVNKCLQLLMVPMEKAYYGIQEEIAKVEEANKQAVKDSKDLYELWIRESRGQLHEAVAVR